MAALRRARLARLIAGAAMLCAAAVTAQADTRLIGPVSSTPGHEGGHCPPGHGLNGLSCAGANCGEIILFCYDLPAGYRESTRPPPTLDADHGAGMVTTSGFVSGIRCAGRACARISVYEANRPDRAGERRCTWSDWFSDENSGFGENLRHCPAGQWVKALACQGGLCDKIRLLCCAP